jgi:hypothetical protein
MRHRPDQVGLGRLQQQVKMIVHQDVGVNSGPEALAQVRQQLQKMETVRSLAENGLALAAPGGDVIATAGPLDVPGACHDAIRAEALGKAQL